MAKVRVPSTIFCTLSGAGFASSVLLKAFKVWQGVMLRLHMVSYSDLVSQAKVMSRQTI